MNAVLESNLQVKPAGSISWAGRIGLGLLFCGLGFLIFVVFSPYRPMLSEENDLAGRIVLSAALLAAVTLARRVPRLAQVTPVLYGLLVMLAAVSADYYLGIHLVRRWQIDTTLARGFALQKLIEVTIIAAAVVLLTLHTGGSLGSIYLQKGKLRWLIVGLILFALSAAAAVPLAGFMFKAENLTAQRLLSWAPWLLIMALSNGVLEELLFRGLFLRKLQPFFGRFGSNLLVMFVFTVLHLGATYTSDMFGFIAAVVPLALVWGWLMQKSDALWASALFHAGMDLPIFIGMLSLL